MASEELKEKLLRDFVEARGGRTATPVSPKVATPVITERVTPEGDTTIGAVTGDSTSKYADIPTSVYSDSDWDEAVAKWIPKPIPNFIHTDQFYRMWVGLDQRFITMLWGESGSGKDSNLYQYCALKRIPYRRITGMAGMTPDVILGSKSFDDKGVFWNPGDADLLCRHGGMLAVSEIGSMPPDTSFALQSALERDGYLSLTEHPDVSQRMLKVSDRTLFAFTSNVRGVGDNQHKYAATNVMDASFLNRVQAMIYCPTMAEHLMVKLLNAQYPTAGDTFIKKVCQFSALMKKSQDAGEMENDWSLRNIEPWIRASLIYGDPAEGFKSTFFDKCSDTEQGLLRGIWKTVDLPGEL